MKLNKKQEQFILENYPDKGLKWCAENINLTENQVRYFCYKKKLKLNDAGKNFIFKQISKKNKKQNPYTHYYDYDKYSSYILGWIWSDGCVNKYSISINITQEDAISVEKLINHFNDFNLYYRNVKNRKPQTVFHLNSVDLCKHLQDCGKYPHSTENYDKLLNNMSDENKIYFFRGLIDGDGSFYFNNKKKYYQFSITSNYNQDWSSVEKFLTKYSIPFSIQKENSKWGSHSKIRITGNNNIKKMVNILYFEDDNIWLERKYNKIKTLINEKT